MNEDEFKKNTRYRISDIARELQVSPQEVLIFVKGEGGKVASTSSMVGEEMRDMIFGHFIQEKKFVDETRKIRAEKQKRLSRLEEQSRKAYEKEQQLKQNLSSVAIPRYRISAIARELQVSSQEVLYFVKQNGGKVASISSMVGEEMRDMIFGNFSQEKKLVDETRKIRAEKQKRLTRLEEQSQRTYEKEQQLKQSFSNIAIGKGKKIYKKDENYDADEPIIQEKSSDFSGSKNMTSGKGAMMKFKKSRVLLLMPFSDDFNQVNSEIKSLVSSMGMICQRVDDMHFNDLVLKKIYDSIKEADFIIADMSGENPNVFYEVGYAHALSKEVILMVKKSDSIPFNLQGFNFIIYDKLDALKLMLKKRLVFIRNNR